MVGEPEELPGVALAGNVVIEDRLVLEPVTTKAAVWEFEPARLLNGKTVKVDAVGGDLDESCRVNFPQRDT